ncbi:hypothetical protein KJ660_02070 [Candidatus Micrarchaeota archaeon]|nr:hypothetical protein [Candidatus Micrarchaeota archaeon]
MKKLFLIFFLLLSFGLVSAAHDTLLSVHGYLMDSGGEAAIGKQITLGICKNSTCTYAGDPFYTKITNTDSNNAPGNFDELLGPVSLNFNQDYWLRVIAAGETMGIFKFKGGQGQINPDDVDSNASYIFGSVNAGGVYIGSSNEIRSAFGPLYVNNSGGSGLYVRDGLGNYGQLRAGTILSTGTTGSTPISGAGTRFMWIPAKSALRAGYVSGSQWDNTSIGNYSTAMGYNTTASGEKSVAMGDETVASGLHSVAIGAYTSATGESSTALGFSTAASGRFSTVMGDAASASADWSTAIGNHSIAQGQQSVAIGYYAGATGTSSIGVGRYVEARANNSFALGRGPEVGPNYSLLNDTADSLMVGFNSNIPTLFVGPSSGAGTTGNIGIGTSTPQSKLDVSGKITANELTGLIYPKQYTRLSRPSCNASIYGALIWVTDCPVGCGCLQVCGVESGVNGWQDLWEPSACSGGGIP